MEIQMLEVVFSGLKERERKQSNSKQMTMIQLSREFFPLGRALQMSTVGISSRARSQRTKNSIERKRYKQQRNSQSPRRMSTGPSRMSLSCRLAPSQITGE
ncbi:hypothetical protein ACFX11_035850 [Malus domestica]